MSPFYRNIPTLHWIMDCIINKFNKKKVQLVILWSSYIILEIFFI